MTTKASGAGRANMQGRAKDSRSGARKRTGGGGNAGGGTRGAVGWSGSRKCAPLSPPHLPSSSLVADLARAVFDPREEAGGDAGGDGVGVDRVGGLLEQAEANAGWGHQRTKAKKRRGGRGKTGVTLKGGDSREKAATRPPPPPPAPRSDHFMDNALEVLTGLDITDGDALSDFARSLIETADPADCAHHHMMYLGDPAVKSIYREQELLLYYTPGQIADRGLTPPVRRRYHPSQIHGYVHSDIPGHHERIAARGGYVSIDSAFDRMHETAAWLRAAGIELGVGRAIDARTSNAELDRAKALAGLSGNEARAKLQQPDRVKLNDREQRLERIGSRLLARKGFNEDGSEKEEVGDG